MEVRECVLCDQLHHRLERLEPILALRLERHTERTPRKRIARSLFRQPEGERFHLDELVLTLKRMQMPAHLLIHIGAPGCGMMIFDPDCRSKTPSTKSSGHFAGQWQSGVTVTHLIVPASRFATT